MRSFTLWCERKMLAEKTIKQYVRTVADFETWLADHGGRALTAATWRDVQKYAETKPFTHATRKGIRSALTAFYRSRGKKDGGPAWAVPTPKRMPGRYRGLRNDEQKDVMLAAARGFGVIEYAMIACLYYQGLRREDCAVLRWDSFHGEIIRIVRKGNLEYQRIAHPKMLEALRELSVTSSPYVFPGRIPGTHVSPATVWMVVRLVGATAGLGRVTPHMLRHTSVAKVNDTQGLRAAADFAGHVDIQTTMIYTRTTDEKLMAGYAAL